MSQPANIRMVALFRREGDYLFPVNCNAETVHSMARLFYSNVPAAWEPFIRKLGFVVEIRQ